MRAEGFSCSLDVFNGGLGISKLQFLIQIISRFFQLYISFNVWQCCGSGMFFPTPESRVKKSPESRIRIRVRLK
jgi:hypothetical protein